MRLNIDIRKKFNLGRINLKLTKELNEAGRIIRKDHVTRLERGMGVDGNRMQELADSTIEAKGFDQILVNTGKMRNLVIERATAKKQEVILYPGRKEKRGKVTNQQIGGFHQRGDGVPERKWFGISQDAEKKAMKAIELKIDRVLRNA
tara:strand:- start:270 stop:713 length:444 start_codon:yes stop_codon:yes gene_type:complete